MKIGFTGTRAGMTDMQDLKFRDLVEDLFHRDKGVKEWHDGDCLGADDEAHDYVKHIPGVYLHLHPCNLHRQRAYNGGDVEYDEMPPLTRNRVIVDSVDLMIATPAGYDEVKRGSGTWATIRYARRRGRHLIIIWPDGTTKEENVQ